MRETIGAVHDDEVEQLFKGLGILEDIMLERLVCGECQRTISLQNFRAITKRDGAFILSCNREDCFGKFAAGLQKEPR